MLHLMEFFHLFTLFLLFIFTLFVLLKFNRASSSKPNLPPSPPKLPIIGNLHQLGTLVHHSLRDLSEKYGPLMLLHFGNKPTLIVSSAEMALEIMKTNDIVFANRPFTAAAKALLYGCTDLGFAPYGEYWRQIRKVAVLDLFSIKRVQSFRYVREEEVTNMIGEVSRFSSKGSPVNLSELVMAFSFADMFPWLGWMDVLTGLNKRMKKVSRELDIFFDQIIDEHINQSRDDDLKDFVDLLLHSQKDTSLGIKITRDNIKAIILDMFVGGADTSSTAIEWAMAELIKNPRVMRKAQEEVRRVVGKKAKVDEDDILQMEYLKSVIKETLRLHAPLPLLVPRETYTSIIINNFHIPPYTRVMINAWAIQRDPKKWDKAGEFIPERFINNIIDFKGQDFEYIPFGSGRRGCPAMSFGLSTVGFSVANLLYWFDWGLTGDAKREELDMSEAFGLTVNKKTPLHVVPISYSV